MERKGAAPISFHMVLSSGVKKELKSIATLPEEIMYNILLLLPADILYDVMRYVCRQWCRIINDPRFVATHLQRSTSTLLFQFPEFHAQYLHVRECDIDFSDIKFQFPGDVLSTCNGLTLVRDRRSASHGLYYIANPVTNRMMTLPTLPLNVYSCSLIFAASSNTYKVVVVTVDKISRYRNKYECAMLTVNVDRAWRLISCPDIDGFRYMPSINRGFVYWGPYVEMPSILETFSSILALNIKSEI